MQNLDSGWMFSINMDIVGALAETFSEHPEEHMPCLMRCCNDIVLSKTLFFSILNQSFVVRKNGLFYHYIWYFSLWFLM